jgi:hypothetical protein
MKRRLAGTATAFLAAAGVATFAKADDRVRSYPPDLHNYSRAAVPGEIRPFRSARTLSPFALPLTVVDAVVNNTDPNLKNTDTFNDGEVSIAVDPLNTNRIVMTAFSGSWGVTSPLWLSTNGGSTWTKEFSVNAPPGAGGVTGCPCDQTIDFGHSGPLAGAFLSAGPDNIYGARSSALTSPTGAFNYFTVGGVAQPINHLDGLDQEDQPWLLIGGGPSRVAGLRLAKTENVYIAYDDFNTAPDMHVAVATATDPLRFTIDNRDGISTGFVNPGHRLAIDPRSNAVYGLFQRRISAGAGGSQNIDYMLNRSTDGGKTWGLNGSPTGMIVANADSTQPQPKFCTVNALLGGVDHAAVDPATGDVVYVYGSRDSATGNNRLAMRRLTPNAAGGLDIGPARFVTGQVQAAIPSVAIAANRTIGVFYYTCDHPSGPFPTMTAHFSTSADLGASFTDRVLETFLSPAGDNGDARQRVLGDYMQVKAVDNTFFGGFTGNGVPFGRSFSNNDPIFFKAPAQ